MVVWMSLMARPSFLRRPGLSTSRWERSYVLVWRAAHSADHAATRGADRRRNPAESRLFTSLDRFLPDAAVEVSCAHSCVSLSTPCLLAQLRRPSGRDVAPAPTPTARRTRPVR